MRPVIRHKDMFVYFIENKEQKVEMSLCAAFNGVSYYIKKGKRRNVGLVTA